MEVYSTYPRKCQDLAGGVFFFKPLIFYIYSQAFLQTPKSFLGPPSFFTGTYFFTRLASLVSRHLDTQLFSHHFFFRTPPNSSRHIFSLHAPFFCTILYFYFGLHFTLFAECIQNFNRVQISCLMSVIVVQFRGYSLSFAQLVAVHAFC